ncbi:MAG TPA: hypothetical protein VN602_02560 [Gemmatimonadaceae bacterium]|nr:hypothetical protein [Gemmatimonadaceae bacterium]
MDTRKENPDKHSSVPKSPSRIAGDEIGEAAGGISGVVVGAAIGSVGGPVGTLIGGIAGAVGGWWAGHAVAEAAQEYTVGDDAVYRNHYDNSPNRLADRDYESVSPAYRLGHLAARNPDYRGRPFDDIEDELRRGWNGGAKQTYGEWDTVRGYVRDAYDRSASATEQQRLRDEANNAANEADRRLEESGDMNIF